jgi:hypothetical protein
MQGKWAHSLGEERRTRDELAARTTKFQEEDAMRTTAVSVERWTAIVASIRRLIDAYNAGAGRAVLVVEEGAHRLMVTIAAAGDAPFLTAALDDTLIGVDARHAGGVSHSWQVRLLPDRSDDATASYLLQHWMQRL